MVSCDWLELGFCGAFFCRMQFKHTLRLQDFMSRTENQEQSRVKRERGKRGNEIVAREREGVGREKWTRERLECKKKKI